ncbi:GntP family permease [Streptoalloteichus tenebrarius]|uniref:GntP family permease n=1 Tax=Streptoalloteichus tenebrarius (strain ATCC 17920 / DSM 40477 / JCM 4838 / CBS 697.72 / NBRC 16177 / NCIMB 11028 / NRRL B-12390 / A12253. 1 / ISP 5477) TaxID=1933 RepID=UPI0020A46C1F|nr:gluconate:H+ symporter [Streptoalloteichus tenebrarius]
MLEWLRQDTAGLLTLSALGIALLLFLIIKVRIEPFIALLLAGLLVALGAGLPVERIVGSAQSGKESLLEGGFGGILGHVTVIIGLGTLLGAVLEASGGAEVLTRRLLHAFGERRAPLAMGLSGLVFGIPVFFDIGIFVLAPLVYVAARRSGRSILLFCLPLLAGLSVTHAFLPPHPGPVALAGLLKVDMGWIIIMGLACGIPAWFVGGVLFSSWIGRRLHLPVPEEVGAGDAAPAAEDRPEPPLALVATIIGIPLVLILGATFGGMALPKGSAVLGVLTFLGSPAVALTIAVLLAIWLLALRRGMTTAEVSGLAARSLRPVGMLLLVVGAGGFFGAVLAATGVGKALAGTLSSAGLPLIVLAYVISCALRVAQGSATVAIVTTGGIVGPLLTDGQYTQPQLALVAVAIAAGSIIASHVNDGGFWIVSRYFGIPVKETLRTWTVLETILSVVGFAVAGLLSLVV